MEFMDARFSVGTENKKIEEILLHMFRLKF